MKTAKDIFDEAGPCAIIDVTHGVAVFILPEWGQIVPLANHAIVDHIVGLWWDWLAGGKYAITNETDSKWDWMHHDSKSFAFEPTAGSHCVRLLPMREFAQYGFGVLWNDAIKEAAARSVAFKFEDAVRV